ncbi:MAG TPA: saccharopine dehydrogenase NADP-binding domain-containing protein [Aliidongia sp.]|nr:saccharopine dehydrogenase NADP-binding domain-containing protein [Aliidongia sp.]
MQKILIIGGTGAFGRRLVQGLVTSTGCAIVIAGRTLATAERFAASLPPGRASALRLDRRALTAPLLEATGAGILVDAAGPFQGADFGAAATAIAAGMHYVDLADARDFVAGFATLDQAAKARGVLAVTGASSTPALSNAVADALVQGWRRVDRIEIAIAPGNRAPRGEAVVRAILSYVGRPVRLFRDGRWQTAPGWSLLARPSIEGLGRRWLSLCETPDLDLMPARFAVRDTVIFRAGLELGLLHLGLAAAGWPVRLGLLPSLAPLSGLARRFADLLIGCGSDRGGMVVEAAGLDEEGARRMARWTLVAEAGDGPVIPTLPALALIRLMLAGEIDRTGAMPCVGLLTLDRIAAEFAPYSITTEITTDPARS